MAHLFLLLPLLPKKKKKTEKLQELCQDSLAESAALAPQPFLTQFTGQASEWSSEVEREREIEIEWYWLGDRILVQAIIIVDFHSTFCVCVCVGAENPNGSRLLDRASPTNSLTYSHYTKPE